MKPTPAAMAAAKEIKGVAANYTHHWPHSLTDSIARIIDRHCRDSRNPRSTLPPCDHDECGPLECRKSDHDSRAYEFASKASVATHAGILSMALPLFRELAAKDAKDAEIAMLRSEVERPRALVGGDGENCEK